MRQVQVRELCVRCNQTGKVACEYHSAQSDPGYVKCVCHFDSGQWWAESWMNLEELPSLNKESFEVRERDGKLDEVVARNCFFHLERMSDGYVWMGIGTARKTYHIHLNAQAGKTIACRCEEA